MWLRTIPLLLLVGLGASLVTGAEPPRFRFVKGETLTYKIVHTTTVNEKSIDEESKKPKEQSHTTQVTLVRQWKVADSAADGSAVLEMSIQSMRLERRLPGQEPDIFDSAKPDDLNKKEMAKLIGRTLAVLKFDLRGKLLDVLKVDVGGELVEASKAPKGMITRYSADLPFKAFLPESAPKTGDTWDRDYVIQLDPPHGTGERYDAKQTYTTLEPTQGLLTVQLKTSLKTMPDAVNDHIPLLPLLHEGTVYFHAETGRYYASRIKITKELKNHLGEGSEYKFVSTFVEDWVAPKSAP